MERSDEGVRYSSSAYQMNEEMVVKHIDTMPSGGTPPSPELVERVERLRSVPQGKGLLDFSH